MTGEEEYEEMLKGKRHNIGGKSRYQSTKRGAYAKRPVNDEEPSTLLFTER